MCGVVVRVASGDREEPVRGIRAALFGGLRAAFVALRDLFFSVIGSNA
jgi:hypothetical protein